MRRKTIGSLLGDRQAAEKRLMWDHFLLPFLSFIESIGPVKAADEWNQELCAL
jgi:hypothetical protein